jgi:hyperosmotically inducible periplasmic protein
MGTKLSNAAAVVAFGGGLLLAGCNADWSDRLPEVAAQSKAQAAAPEAPGAASAGAIVAPAPESKGDAAVSAKVESALKSEPDLHGTSIAVRTDAGVVTLRGTAKDPQLRSMAAQVALSIDGVKLVKNEITLGHEA